MRATVSRKTPRVAMDSWGHAQHTREVVAQGRYGLRLPCLIWADEDQLTRGDNKIAVLSVFRMLAPVGADIRIEDELTDIRDRRNHPVFEEIVKMEVANRSERPSGGYLSLTLNGVR